MKKFLEKWLKPILMLVGVLFFALALFLLYRSLKNYHYADIMARIQNIPVSIIILALSVTVCNYLVLGGYDLPALMYVKKKLPYRRIGLSIFGSSALQYRYYSSWGIEPRTIARLITFCIITFWIGLGAAGGVALLFSQPVLITGIPLLAVSSKIIGCLMLFAVTAYLVASADWILVSLVFHSGVETYNFKGLRAFKEKFHPLWTPRFLALSGGFSLPSVAKDMVVVMSRGKRALDQVSK